MSTQPLSELSQEKREKILATAKARFLHYGVAKTTMRDIADDLSISVSNLYLYFENKREIVLAIAEQCREESEIATRGILEDTSLDPSQILEHVLAEKFRVVQAFRTDSPKGKELIAYLLHEFPERVTLWQQNFEKMVQTVIIQGNESGAFHVADTAYVARMIRIATVQFFLPAHIELPAMPTEEELLEVLRWLKPLLK